MWPICARAMAVLAGGKVRLEGAPHDLIRSIEGRVWQRTIPHTALPEMQDAHEVISHRFFRGRDRGPCAERHPRPKALRPSSAGLRMSISRPFPKPAARLPAAAA